jgi:hypothetical protein
MSNLRQQAVVPSSPSYFNSSRTAVAEFCVGMRIGLNTIISFQRADHVGWRGRSILCLIRCDCGVERYLFLQRLRLRIADGKPFTCRGCAYLRRGGKKIGDTEWRSLFCHLKNRAVTRKVSCSLTLTQFKWISKLPCAYCNMPPSNYYSWRSRSVLVLDHEEFTILYSGIDRLDSSLGYILGNIVPCCLVCNRAKNDLALAEWCSHLVRLGCPDRRADILAYANALVLESKSLVPVK